MGTTECSLIWLSVCYSVLVEIVSSYSVWLCHSSELLPGEILSFHLWMCLVQWGKENESLNQKCYGAVLCFFSLLIILFRKGILTELLGNLKTNDFVYFGLATSIKMLWFLLGEERGGREKDVTMMNSSWNATSAKCVIVGVGVEIWSCHTFNNSNSFSEYL